MGNFKGYGKGFKPGNNILQSQPRARYLLKISLKDIAKARKCHIDTVRRAVKAGKFDPERLESVAGYIASRNGMDVALGR